VTAAPTERDFLCGFIGFISHINVFERTDTDVHLVPVILSRNGTLLEIVYPGNRRNPFSRLFASPAPSTVMPMAL